MLNLKRILFPTDFSSFAREGEHYACALARQFTAELHLLNVIEELPPVAPVPGAPLLFMGGIDPGNLRQEAEQALQAFPDATWGKGLPVVRAVRVGSPFVEIIRYAREQDIDLIVLGTHGRTGLSHVLLGSVAERVVRKAPCPVLTVRPKTHSFVMP